MQGAVTESQPPLMVQDLQLCVGGMLKREVLIFLCMASFSPSMGLWHLMEPGFSSKVN